MLLFFSQNMSTSQVIKKIVILVEISLPYLALTKLLVENLPLSFYDGNCTSSRRESKHRHCLTANCFILMHTIVKGTCTVMMSARVFVSCRCQQCSGYLISYHGKCLSASLTSIHFWAMEMSLCQVREKERE